MRLIGLLIVAGALATSLPRPAFSAESAYPKEPAALFRHLCGACHGPRGAGDGPNAQYLDPRPADLTDPDYMATATERTLFTVINGGGKALEITPTMPAWGKTLTQVQIKDLVAYVRSLSRPPGPGDVAPRSVRSETPTGEARCRVCHAMAVAAEPIAPNLGMTGSKLRRDWLTAFLHNPGRVRPVGYKPLTKSRMPNFQFTDQEIRALTEYLMTKRDSAIDRAERSLGEVPTTPGLIARGRRLYEEEYACDACHRLGDKGGMVGPDLTPARRRLQTGWLIKWLRHPQAIRPDSPMPHLGLNDSEINSLIAYVFSAGEALSGPGGPVTASMPPGPDLEKSLVKQGETLVKENNCLGCHTMQKG